MDLVIPKHLYYSIMLCFFVIPIINLNGQVFEGEETTKKPSKQHVFVYLEQYPSEYSECSADALYTSLYFLSSKPWDSTTVMQFNKLKEYITGIEDQSNLIEFCRNRLFLTRSFKMGVEKIVADVLFVSMIRDREYRVEFMKALLRVADHFDYKIKDAKGKEHDLTELLIDIPNGNNLHKLSIFELISKLATPRNTVSNIENGGRQDTRKLSRPNK